MNDDDAVGRALRDLAGPTPVAPVDRQRVLLLGRRRRRARAGALSAVTAVAVVGAWTGAAALGVTSVPGIAPAGTTTPTVRAVIDEEAGTITTPLDGVFMSGRDLAVVHAAVETYVAGCMVDAGYDEYADFDSAAALVAHPDARRAGAHRYGVWSEAEVREQGYAAVPPEGLEPAYAAPPRTEEGRSVMLGCHLETLDAGLTYEPQDFEELAPLGWTRSLDTPEGERVARAWARCMRDADLGYQVRPEVLVPSGIVDQPLAEQVRVGLVDVACKREHDVVRRLADLDATAEAEYLERAQEYIAALRPVQRAVVARAEALLEEHGVEVPEP